MSLRNAGEAEKIRLLPVSIARSSLNTIFGQLTFGASVFVLFLSELGLSKTNIGFLKSLLPFAGILAPFIAPWVRRFGYKRAFLVGYGGRKFVLACLVFAPALAARVSDTEFLIYVAVVIGVFALLRAVAETALYPWQREFIPDSVRGKFTAATQIAGTFAGILAAALASWIIGLSGSTNRYIVLIVLGCSIGFVGVLLGLVVPGGAPQPKAGGGDHFRNIGSALRDRRFVVFLVGLSCVTFAAMPLMSFVPLYMRERIGLTSSNVVFLDTGFMIGGLLFSYLWGWTADRYGSKSVLTVVLTLFALLPFAWLGLAVVGALEPLLAFLLSLLFGACQVGFFIGSTHLLYNTVVPPNREGAYMPVYYAVLGLTGGIGPILAGSLLDVTAGRYGLVFLGCVVLLGIGLFVFRSIEYGAVSRTRDVLRLFIYGNPVTAFGLTIRYGGMLHSEQRLTAAARMGQTRNPIHAEELLQMLRDPSFNVRYEAVLSAGKAPFDSRLVHGLISLLDDRSSQMRVAAAWSLGRLGARDAVEPLRRLVSRDDRATRCMAVRALGMLGDRESLASFVEGFDRTGDDEERIAFASAIGNIGAPEGLSTLLDGLNEAKPGGPVELETAHATARLVGVESAFIRLYRRAGRRTEEIGTHRAADSGTVDDAPVTDAVGMTEVDIAQAVAGVLLPRRRDLVHRLGEEEAGRLFDAWSEERLQEASGLLAAALGTITAEIGVDRREDPAARVLEFCAPRVGPERPMMLLLAVACLVERLRSAG